MTTRPHRIRKINLTVNLVCNSIGLTVRLIFQIRCGRVVIIHYLIMNVIGIRWTVNFLSVIKVALKFHSNRLSLLSNHCQQDKLFSLEFFYIFWTFKSFYKNTESYPKVFLAWFLEIPSTQDLFKDWRI